MLQVRLVQQAAWDVPVDTMPLAAGYIKAVLDADADLAPAVNTEICSFRGGATLYQMARRLFADGPPDLLAFSVLGWNYRAFGCLAETYKQLRPDGVVVFGGVHVAGQARRVFREFPWVDVIVDGEGELAFRDLVEHFLTYRDGGRDRAPASVLGISYRCPGGGWAENPARERVEDLDIIPSPFLTGSIPMTDRAGRFRYDVALMETNRGCPYKCSFCFWGGAIGQRVRAFSRDRLAAELDYFGALKVPSVCLCDANFGMLEFDEEFVEDLIHVRERYGYPRGLESSWAKNKSERFRRIVRALKQNGFQSSFVLSLQTLSDAALTGMRRRNMKVNHWEDLVEWLAEEGLDCVGELIWGAPGETMESFLDGYDRLAQKVSRIAVYPLLLLPNTDYADNRAAHGFVTVRGEADDFEYVLASGTAPLAEHLHAQRFLFFARLLSENHFLHHIWRPVLQLTGLTQSQVIISLMEHVDNSDDPAVTSFRELIPVIAESPAVIRALRRLYEDPALAYAIDRWWRTDIASLLPPAWRSFGEDLYKFECWSRPRYVLPGNAPPGGWRLEPRDGEPWYVSEPTRFSCDIAQALRCGVRADDPPPPPVATWYAFQARAGFYENADNHEIALGYLGTPVTAGGT
jgi:radical SAM C-methyltransferase